MSWLSFLRKRIPVQTSRILWKQNAFHAYPRVSSTNKNVTKRSNFLFFPHAQAMWFYHRIHLSNNNKNWTIQILGIRKKQDKEKLLKFISILMKLRNNKINEIAKKIPWKKKFSWSWGKWKKNIINAFQVNLKFSFSFMKCSFFAITLDRL